MRVERVMWQRRAAARPTAKPGAAAWDASARGRPSGISDAQPREWKGRSAAAAASAAAAPSPGLATSPKGPEAPRSSGGREERGRALEPLPPPPLTPGDATPLADPPPPPPLSSSHWLAAAERGDAPKATPALDVGGEACAGAAPASAALLLPRGEAAAPGEAAAARAVSGGALGEPSLAEGGDGRVLRSPMSA